MVANGSSLHKSHPPAILKADSSLSLQIILQLILVDILSGNSNGQLHFILQGHFEDIVDGHVDGIRVVTQRGGTEGGIVDAGMGGLYLAG